MVWVAFADYKRRFKNTINLKVPQGTVFQIQIQVFRPNLFNMPQYLKYFRADKNTEIADCASTDFGPKL